MNKQGELSELRDALRDFAAERDWEQFHTPKNLAIAVSLESAEVLEHFLWASDEQVGKYLPEKIEAIGEELADVLLYLIRLADRLEVDLVDAARRKIEKNASKYPVLKAKGNAKKYTEL